MLPLILKVISEFLLISKVLAQRLGAQVEISFQSEKKGCWPFMNYSEF